MAAGVKERMDECVARRRGTVALWHGGMENGKRRHGEGQEREERGRKSFLKWLVDRGEDRCETTPCGGEEGERKIRMHGCVKTLKKVPELAGIG